MGGIDNPRSHALVPSPLLRRLRKLTSLFPSNWCLAFLVALDGYAFMHPVLREVQAREYSFWLALDNWQEIMQVVGLLEIPRLVLGVGLQVIALGLILKARIAWAFSLVLLIGVGTFAILGDSGHAGLGIYTLVLILALMAYWRRFDRASVTAGSLFALVSVLSLLIYAVFGTLYLGDEFNPPVHDAGTALYFSIVSMSTVGYGDITPHSGAARLFTASIIILGITVFATSVSAIAGPVIGGNLKRLVKGRFSTAMRKNHIIIAGATPLALSVYDGLRRRGDEVTVIVPAGVPQEYPATADLIEGDPSSVEVLRAAGVTRARYVLAARRRCGERLHRAGHPGSHRRPGRQDGRAGQHQQAPGKIRRVRPDMVFSVQLLGAELLARAINGEPLDSQAITDLFFAKAGPAAAEPA